MEGGPGDKNSTKYIREEAKNAFTSLVLKLLVVHMTSHTRIELDEYVKFSVFMVYAQIVTVEVGFPPKASTLGSITEC